MSRVLICLVLLSSAGQSRDVDGQARDLFAPSGPANVLMFIASDCPVSNGYAPEIQRICRDYRAKGVTCSLVYEDVAIGTAQVRAHRDEYGYTDIPAVIDADRAIATRANATVTPQAVVVGPGGAGKYRGRIDNQYAALAKPRRVVTVHDLRDALDAVLARRPVANPETEAFGCFIASKNDSGSR
jgi:thiol-disulfide isomerase/thioredoxin